MTQPSETERRFADWLKGLVKSDDRATLAALRRGLGMDSPETAWMLRYLPAGLGSGRDEEAMCQVAALFAYHPKPWPAEGQEGRLTNIGASLALLVDEERQKNRGETPASVEARFEAILESHPDDLPEHLRRIVGLLKSKDIPVDWAQLLHDVRRWGWESRAVQWEWARAFWRDTKAAS